MQRRAGPHRQSGEEPGDGEDDPRHLGEDRRDTVGDESPKLHVLIVFLIDQRKAHVQIRADRRERVGGRVADAVQQLDPSGMIVHQHEHGHEHGAEKRPLGRTGGHEQIDEDHQDHKGYEHGNAGKVDGLEPCWPWPW